MQPEPTTALILFSHGSLLCGAGETLKQHAARMRERGQYVAVEMGYLNYSEPPFEMAVERCIKAGAARIIIVPYFLVPGKFVQVDLPPRVATARQAYPKTEFILARAIGYSETMAEAILQVATSARPPERWRDDLHSAFQFCESREDCPLFGTELCPNTSAKVAAL
jgi:sirohydrochlorin ferrochelatase